MPPRRVRRTAWASRCAREEGLTSLTVVTAARGPRRTMRPIPRAPPVMRTTLSVVYKVASGMATGKAPENRE